MTRSRSAAAPACPRRLVRLLRRLPGAPASMLDRRSCRLERLVGRELLAAQLGCLRGPWGGVLRLPDGRGALDRPRLVRGAVAFRRVARVEEAVFFL